MRTSKQITAGIAGVARSTEKNSAAIHELLIEIAGHMVAHKEPSLGEKMLNAFHGKKHGTAIAAWLAKHTVFTRKDGKPGIVESRFAEIVKGQQPNANGCHMEAAALHTEALRMEDRWDNETDPVGRADALFDAVASAERLLKRIASASKAGNGEHLDLERYIRSAIEQYQHDAAALKGGVQ